MTANVRYLIGEGRLGGIPERWALEWQHDGQYELLGEGEEYETARVQKDILRFLEDGREASEAQLLEDLRVARSTLRDALDALTSLANGMPVSSTGEGRRNDPCRYRLTKHLKLTEATPVAVEGVPQRHPSVTSTPEIVQERVELDDAITVRGEEMDPCVTLFPADGVSDERAGSCTAAVNGGQGGEQESIDDIVRQLDARIPEPV